MAIVFRGGEPRHPPKRRRTIFIAMKAKTEIKKPDPARDPKREAARRKRLEPAKHLEGNVAKLVERGRLMGF